MATATKNRTVTTATSKLTIVGKPRSETPSRAKLARDWELRRTAENTTRPAGFIAGYRSVAPKATALDIRKAYNAVRVNVLADGVTFEQAQKLGVKAGKTAK